MTVFLGRRIALFFKPYVERAERIAIVCLTADNPTFLKWAENVRSFELFTSVPSKFSQRITASYHVNRLHAKIYVIDDRIWLTSANLTYGSLYLNVEHAIQVTDEEAKDQILKQIQFWRDRCKTDHK
jgi:phosphatidylserine/phosphatidylglycerophosphate/cardiolipin synthase-like enzyme